MRHPSYVGATSARMTALQFPTSSDGRDTWTDEERVAELRPWHQLVVGPGGQADVDARCEAGRRAQLVEDRAAIALLQRDLAWLREEHDTQAEAQRWLQEKYDEGQVHLAWLAGQHDHQARLAEAAMASATDLRAGLERRDALIAQLRAKISRKNETITRLRGRLRGR